MEEKEILITILAMAIVTWVPRALPFLLLEGKRLRPNFVTWLDYVPVAVISAILAPEIFLKNRELNLSFDNQFFWIAIPTFLVAYLTRNLALTIVSGLGLLALWRIVL